MRLISSIYERGHYSQKPDYLKWQGNWTHVVNAVRASLEQRGIRPEGYTNISIALACLKAWKRQEAITTKKQAKRIINSYFRLNDLKPLKHHSPKAIIPSRPVTKPNPKYEERKTFYDSREWLDLRYRALKLYGRKCMSCGDTPQNGAILHVDHVKPRSLYPHLELDIRNLQILCKACNLGKSNKDCIDYRTSKILEDSEEPARER